jgi:hypothetical protein
VFIAARESGEDVELLLLGQKEANKDAIPVRHAGMTLGDE